MAGVQTLQSIIMSDESKNADDDDDYDMRLPGGGGSAGFVTKSVYAAHEKSVRAIWECLRAHVTIVVFHVAPASPGRLRVSTVFEAHGSLSAFMAHSFTLGTDLDKWLIGRVAALERTKKRVGRRH